MVEFGGLRAVRKSLVDNNQTAVGMAEDGVVSLDSGKPIQDVDWDRRTSWNLQTQHMDSVGLIHPQGEVLWDLVTGEHERTRVELPTNGYWDIYSSFTQSQPQLAFKKVKFLNGLRYYTVADDSFVHIHTVYDRESY